MSLAADSAPLRPIWLCADDYGIAPGVSKAIRDLVARGRLHATTSRALYVANERGELARVFESSGGLHGLVVSGDTVWFAEGTELGVLEDGRVSETRGAGPSVR